MATAGTVSKQGEQESVSKKAAGKVLRLVLGLSLALLVAGRASAQYGGGTGMGGPGTSGGVYTPPKGGYGSGAAAGAGIGAAAGAGLLFLAFHHSSTIGCVQPGEEGLRFVDEKKNTFYNLVSGDVLVKAGERVALRGQKSKSDSGVRTFTAKKLVKELGSCGDAKTTSDANTARTEHPSN